MSESGGVTRTYEASGFTIYQLNRDEMSSEAALTRSPHHLEVVLGLWTIFHGRLSSSISPLPSRLSAGQFKRKGTDSF